ncbi:NmrA family NAD(P)-binding protein [Amorphoplanes nipponensis]|uniref:NmrA family transcriptional regulator n=1 Tax=Actinoplanes nipponensis TaxID=135950 RepID=A0A919MGR5_9ACTN|nr:NmrA family NAD(P)-binding protein [Actinoplanes nipponensis]GIE48874.1 NmrA family transcriptional regulator [Actinoplanes nipponensis]
MTNTGASRPILVTGATGNVGGAVARSLLGAGLPVRVAGTDVDRLRALFPPAEPVHLDLRRPGTFPAAVAGAGGLFLVRPPAIARVGPTLNALLDTAARAGAGPVVFASVTGADTNRVVPHHRVETHLRASGQAWTILRPGFFAQNLADAYREDIRSGDRIYVPAGSGRAAFIDVRDIGDVAAVVFRDPGAHRDTAYTLTGPEALSFAEVAALLSDNLGRRIRYQPASIPGYLRHLRRRRLPLLQCVVQTLLHAGLRRGQAAPVDPTLGRLLGRPPRTMAQYVSDQRGLWMSP